MKQTTIRSRIDPVTKQEAQLLLKRFGLSMSDAIRLFLHQVVLEKGLPFNVKLPEKEVMEYDRWFREQVTAAVEEADKPDAVFIPHDEVSDRWANKREDLSAKIDRKSEQ